MPERLSGSTIGGVMILLVLGLAPAAALADAVMSPPTVQVLAADADRTVVQIRFPVAAAPDDWQRPGTVVWQGLEVYLTGDDESILRQPPAFSRLVALRSPGKPAWRLRAVQWHREPTDASAAVVELTGPGVYRGVPLAGLVVRPEAGDGILDAVVVEVDHPEAGLDKARLDDPAARRAGREPVPQAVLNPEVYAVQRQLSAALAAGAAKDSYDDPFARTGHWLRCEVDPTGVYRITGADLEAAGISLGEVDPAKVRVFKGGGLTLLDDPEAADGGRFPRGSLTEVAVRLDDGGDGEMNLTDRVVFYALGATTWRDQLEPGAARLDHFSHPQQARGVYWLTWEDDTTASPFTGSPLRVATRDATPHGITPVTTHLARYHGEQNVAPVVGWLEDNWAWDGSVLSRFDKVFTLEGVVEGEPAEFSMELTGVRGDIFSPPAFQVRGYFNDDVANGVDFSWLLIRQSDAPVPIRFGGATTALVRGSNRVKLDYLNYPVTETFIAFNLFQLEYPATLVKSDYAAELTAVFWGAEVPAPATPLDVRFTAATGGGATVWDVSDPAAPVRLVGTAGAGDAYTVGLLQDPGQDVHLVMFDDGDLRPALARERATVVALREEIPAADYFVLAPSEFAGAADELAAIRSRTLPGVDDPVAVAVDLDDIYANFSGGQKDWRAIRQFLRYEFLAHGQRLRWVCLLGDASIDYKNNFGYTPGASLFDWIPTDLYNSWPRVLISNDTNGPYTTDESLVALDTPPSSPPFDIPDLGVGRLPANTADQARSLVERIGRYSEDTPTGAWRNRVLMSADDLRYRQQDPYQGQAVHTVQAETLSTSYLPESIEINKVYLIDYPLVGIYKPDARRELLARLNEGTTIFYYVGHGASVTLADEHLFEIGEIAGLVNGDRRFVFIAFSCDVGVYADPNTQCWPRSSCWRPRSGSHRVDRGLLGEFKRRQRPLSEAFMEEYYPGRHVHRSSSLGEALSQGKAQMWALTGGLVRNARRYNLTGDPAVQLPNPVDDLQYTATSSDSLLTGRLHRLALDETAGEVSFGPATSYQVRAYRKPRDPSFHRFQWHRLLLPLRAQPGLPRQRRPRPRRRDRALPRAALHARGRRRLRPPDRRRRPRSGVHRRAAGAGGAGGGLQRG
ncbi:MAG: C25 family cysteine peptidase [Candidatus Krumholzibacteriia bacterium]